MAAHSDPKTTRLYDLRAEEDLNSTIVLVWAMPSGDSRTQELRNAFASCLGMSSRSWMSAPALARMSLPIFLLLRSSLRGK